MLKKIFLAFLLLGFTFNPLTAEKARAVSESEIKEIASSTQKSIEKDVLPGWQQCLQAVKDPFIKTKNFVSEKIKNININKITGDIKGEFNREVGDFKKDLPETFKGLTQWFKTFSDNWLNKP